MRILIILIILIMGAQSYASVYASLNLTYNNGVSTQQVQSSTPILAVLYAISTDEWYGVCSTTASPGPNLLLIRLKRMGVNVYEFNILPQSYISFTVGGTVYPVSQTWTFTDQNAKFTGQYTTTSVPFVQLYAVNDVASAPGKLRVTASTYFDIFPEPPAAAGSGGTSSPPTTNPTTQPTTLPSHSDPFTPITPPDTTVPTSSPNAISYTVPVGTMFTSLGATTQSDFTLTFDPANNTYIGWVRIVLHPLILAWAAYQCVCLILAEFSK